jgi:hypothetical protein
VCWAAFTSTPLFQQSRFAQRCQKVSLDGSEGLADDRWAGDQNEVDCGKELMLVQPKRLAEKPARPIARDSISQAARSDYAQPRMRGGSQWLPIRNQRPGRDPFALLPDAREIPPLLDPCRAPEPPALWRFAPHDKVRRGSSACVRRVGGCAGLRGRSCWHCDSKIHAGVCVGFLRVDIVVS